MDSKKLLMVCAAVGALAVAGLCVVIAATSIAHSRAEARAEKERDDAIAAVKAATEARAASDRAQRAANLKAIDEAQARAEAAQREAEREISGRGNDGVAAIDSFQTRAKMNGTHLEGLEVTGVSAGGAMAAGYGLRTGDEIVKVDGMKIGDVSADDPEVGKAMVVQKGLQGNLPIEVIRGGKQVTLKKK